MAKREFIEVNQLEKVTLEDSLNYMEWHRDSEVDCAIVAPRLTEQDIVKPYLELLLKEMQSLKEINHADNRYDKGYQHGRASCEAMVMHMIGNLLSEQGDTE